MSNHATIERKLSYLYEELEKLGESSYHQQKFLLDKIDYFRSELLQEKTLKRLKEIEEDEISQG